MTAIADALLDSIKQYAQSLKKQMGISLSQAQELAARAHSFADWHELAKVADRSPYDPRLRAAAISARSGPGLRVSAAIQVLRTAAERLALAAGIGAREAAIIDANARAFAATDPEVDSGLAATLTTVDHLAMSRLLIPQGTAATDSASSLGNLGDGPQFKLNLFEPQAHLVLVSACSGWGKSGFAAGLAGAHFAEGGTVLYIDPLFNPEPNERDKPAKLLGGLMGKPDVNIVETSELTERKSLSRFTLVRSNGQGSPDELLAALDRAKAWLKPFSVVVIDEAHFPQPFGEPKLEFKTAMAAIIDELIAAGIAVVLISQDALLDELPVREETQECMLLLFGMGHYAPSPVTVPSKRRKRTKLSLTIQEVLTLPPPPGPPSAPDQLQALAKQLLQKSRDEYTSWIGVATIPDEDSRAFVGKQLWSSIEAPFRSLHKTQ